MRKRVFILIDINKHGHKFNKQLTYIVSQKTPTYKLNQMGYVKDIKLIKCVFVYVELINH